MGIPLSNMGSSSLWGYTLDSIAGWLISVTIKGGYN